MRSSAASRVQKLKVGSTKDACLAVNDITFKKGNKQNEHFAKEKEDVPTEPLRCQISPARAARNQVAVEHLCRSSTADPGTVNPRHSSVAIVYFIVGIFEKDF